MSLRILLVSVIACVVSSPLSLSADETIFPKTGPVEKVIVVDVQQDLGIPSVCLPYTAHHDTAATLACFQGLINRQDSTTKVYLKGMPVRLFWNLYDGGSGSPDDLLIEEMKRDVDVEFAELDTRKSLPALAWLLRNYGQLVKKTVSMPSITDLGWSIDTASQGADSETFKKVELFTATRAAVLNAAIFNDALPIAEPATLFIGKREGFYYPRLNIPNFETPVEALQWSYETYFEDPRRNEKLLGVANENCQNPPHMWDYWYATYTYVIGYMLPKANHHKIDDSKTAQWVQKTIFPQYSPGTPVFGEIEGSRIIPHMQGKGGFQIEEGPVPNLSALSAFEATLDWFKPASTAKAHEIDPNGIYIAWNTVDGDANDIALLTMKGLNGDPLKEKVKLGVRYNPFFIDLNPLLIRWLTELDHEFVDLIPSPHDGGIPGSVESEKAYAKDYAYMHREGNEQFQVYNFFGGIPQGDEDTWSSLMAPLNPLLCIRGYQGDPNGTPAWKQLDGMLHSNQIGFGRWDGMVHQYKHAILSKKPNEPLFMVMKSPSEFGVRAWSMVQDYQDTLLADPEVQKAGKLYFLLPRDLAATVNAYMETKGVTELSQ